MTTTTPTQSPTTLSDTQTPSFTLPKTLPTPPALTTLGHVMPFIKKPPLRRLATSLRLLLQLRGRLPKNSILTVKLAGSFSERNNPPRPFSTPELSLPVLIDTLRLAAHDPRISHLHLRVEPLACGWAKVAEIRRHIDYFAASGKTVSAYMEAGGPKEFFVVMGYALYVPPEAALSLRGFVLSGSFLRGALDKIGISPQVERIGAYKSAGDQLARRDMAPEQREVFEALLNETNDVFIRGVCEALKKDREIVAKFIDEAPQDMKAFVDAGMIAGTCYESQLVDALKLRFARKGPFGRVDDKMILRQELPSVDILRYARRVSPRLLGIEGGKRIAVIRAVGVITPGKSSSSPLTGGTLGSDTLVELLRKARDDRRVAGVVLRVDSPGGAALSSDIVWNELKELRAVKPVVASQVDAAASGGYYLSMACEIVAEALTITGSVGVVTAKPSLEELYRKIGLGKENVSTGGKYAELLVDDRGFSEEEWEYFKRGARMAYDRFVAKAAESRGKTVEEMDEVAQGRVWTGREAKERGLVDHIGGFWRAIEVLKERCKIEDEYVKVEEIRVSLSFAERLGIAGIAGVEGGGSTEGIRAALMGPLAIAEVDGGVGELSPLSKVMVEVGLAPVVGVLTKMGGSTSAIMGALQTVVKMLQ